MPVRALAAGSLLLAAAVAGSSSAAASRRPALAVTSGPKVQTLQVQVVTRRNAKTHRWVSKLVLGTANFHVVARNAGDVALTNVTVHDARSPACTRSIARLAPGASVAYACTARNVGRNFTNRIAVSGMPDHADAPVRALASVRVKVKPKRHSSHVPPPAFQQGAQISHAPALPLTG